MLKFVLVCVCVCVCMCVCECAFTRMLIMWERYSIRDHLHVVMYEFSFFFFGMYVSLTLSCSFFPSIYLFVPLSKVDVMCVCVCVILCELLHCISYSLYIHE